MNAPTTKWVPRESRQILATIVLLLFFATTACVRSGPTVRDWSEEVELDDGDVITIDRHVEFEESNWLVVGETR